MEQLTVERSIWIDAPRERVWQAVTDPEQVAQWFLPPVLGAGMKRDDCGKIFVSMGDMDIAIAILEAAGLVAVHQKGREKRYTLIPEPLGELEQWIKDISAKWDERLLRLKTLLEHE